MICHACYMDGLREYTESRSHEIAEATFHTYMSDGKRFSDFFRMGYLVSRRGTRVTTTARTCIEADDFREFYEALCEIMKSSSAAAYETPVIGAFNNAGLCSHCTG